MHSFNVRFSQLRIALKCYRLKIAQLSLPLQPNKKLMFFNLFKNICFMKKWVEELYF